MFKKIIILNDSMLISDKHKVVVDIGEYKVSVIVYSINKTDKKQVVDIKGCETKVIFDFNNTNNKSLSDIITNIISLSLQNASIPSDKVYSISVGYPKDIEYTKINKVIKFQKNTQITTTHTANLAKKTIDKLLKQTHSQTPHNVDSNNDENTTSVATYTRAKNFVKKNVLANIANQYWLDENSDSQLNSPIGKWCNILNVEFFLASVPENNLLNFQNDITKHFKIEKIIPNPLANSSILLSQSDKNLNLTLLVDIGFKKTTLTIYKKGVLEDIKTIHIGGYDVTSDINYAFEIDFDQAEDIKKTYGVCSFNSKDEIPLQIKSDQLDNNKQYYITKKELSEVIFPRYYEILKSVKEYIDKPINLCVFTGGGSKIAELTTFAKEILKTGNTRIATNKLLENNIENFDHYENKYEYSTALGMTVFDLKHDNYIKEQSGNNIVQKISNFLGLH